jgi:hypothetical protein
MSDDISVTVTAPGTSPRTYIFDEQPVEVGRAPECHVSICHEAVPRRLCSAWLEDGGRGVRVEERPGLTNPLMRGVRPIRGGIGGARLDLSVGPVGISFSPASARQAAEDSHFSLFAISKIGIGAILLLTLLLGASLALGPDDPAAVQPLPELPGSPFEKEADDLDERGNVHRADLLYTRARSMLEVRNPPPLALASAAVMLRRSALMLEGSKESALAGEIAREAAALLASVEQRYRKEVLDLRRFLKTGDLESAESSARVVAEFLEGGGREIPEDLATLAAGREKGGPR